MILKYSSSILFTTAVALCAFNVLTGMFAPEFYLSLMTEETGMVENLQVKFLLMALVLNVFMLASLRRADHPALMRGWLVVTALGIFFVLGEELSWGQHYIGWDAFGWFVHKNDQMETNLHNTSSWLDQKPRMLLVTGILLGGVVLPLLERARGHALTRLPEWFKPRLADLPLAAMVIVAQMPKQINGLKIPGVYFDIPNLRFSEMQELVIYIFFVAYLLTLWKHHIRRA
ncbi:MAG: hypothetical protein EON60_07675 [Alphaproteobacteria bacterium]|nr:MAG: hypothetical protein EON60_07675 [Alphaproteobacteria bacterium]